MLSHTDRELCEELRKQVATIRQSFFDAVIYAPERYLALGYELERFDRTLAHLLLQETTLSDDAVEASGDDKGEQVDQRLFGFALEGAGNSLEALDAVLTSLRINRDRTEKWWSDFDTKIRSNGCDGVLDRIKDRIAYRCWMFDHVVTVVKHGIKAAKDPTTVVTSQVEHLLHIYLNKLERTDTIVTRFRESLGDTENLPPSSYIQPKSIIRATMFWCFKAIGEAAVLARVKYMSAEAYVNVLKATWLLSTACLSQDQPSNNAPEEIKELVRIVSEELVEAFRSIKDTKMELPDLDSIEAFGEFRMFIDELEDDGWTSQGSSARSSFSYGHGPSARVNFLSTSSSGTSEVGTESHRLSHDDESIITSSGGGEYGPPEAPPPPFPPPAAPPCTLIRRKSKRPHKPSSLVLDRLTDNDEPTKLHQAVLVRTARDTPPGPLHSPKPLTPPISPAISLASNRSFEFYPYSISDTVPSADELAVDQDILSPTLSTIIDEIYCDSPTLGIDRYNETPTPTEVIVDTDPKSGDTKDPVAGTLIERLREAQRRSIFAPASGPRRASRVLDTSPAHPVRRLSAPALERVRVADSCVLKSESEPSLLPAEGDLRELEFAVEYGIRPGETEIMPDELAAMQLRCGTATGPDDAWQDCTLRLFQSHISGDFRLLTVIGDRVDQRLVPAKNAELVPEYGYHENFPVIFLRHAGPGAYSRQPSNPQKSKKASIPVPEASPASLYYKFSNILNMFAFQLAMLGESVESDCIVRNVKHTRGFLSGEHSDHKGRIQLWKEVFSEHSGLRRPTTHHRKSSIAATFRSAPDASLVKIDATRLVMYLGDRIISLFVTDDITVITMNNGQTLKIKPSSHRAFGNPSSVKACVLGTRELSGGFRLDKEEELIEDQERFEDFKWFEIEFNHAEEASAFEEDITAALQERRRQRLVVLGLKRQAAHGVRAGEVGF